MHAGPRIDSYEWAGGREPMLRFGPEGGPVAVLALPLFEEANRTRTFGVSILRALGARGIGGVLPELPAQGESELPTREASLANMRQTFSAAVRAARPAYTVAIRGGALLTHEASALGRWLFAPVDGGDVVRELLRAGQLDGTRFPVDAPGADHLIAGNLLSRTLLRELRDATPDRSTPSRSLRLSSDPREADRKVEGMPLWRRAEPDNDVALSHLLANDIADWITSCAG